MIGRDIANRRLLLRPQFRQTWA